MKNFLEKNNTIKKYIFLMFLLLLSLAISLCYSSLLYIKNIYTGDRINLYSNQTPSIEGMDKLSEHHFKTLTNDPQFIFYNFNSITELIYIDFLYSLDYDLHITIYYDDGSGFSQNKSSSIVTTKGESSVYIKVPKDYYCNLRVDIGNSENITFYLKEIYFYENAVVKINYFIFISIFMFLYNFTYENSSNWKNTTLIIFSLSIFTFCIKFLEHQLLIHSLYYSILVLCLYYFIKLELNYLNHEMRYKHEEH